jgi:hypothetical protein
LLPRIKRLCVATSYISVSYLHLKLNLFWCIKSYDAEIQSGEIYC